ncbi:MAG: hypothetical protein JO205_09245 [Pseudolabrys sp.]|nr:hypothetical protein [Pseudolabrys sp.]
MTIENEGSQSKDGVSVRSESGVTRRVVMRLAFALPAVTSPSVVKSCLLNDNDPIFAAIAAHQRAYDAYCNWIDKSESIEAVLPAEKRTWYSGAYERQPPDDCKDDQAWVLLQIAGNEFFDKVCRAHVVVVSTEPTTFAGVLALLSYIGTREKGGNEFLGDIFTGEYLAGKPVYRDTGLLFVETITKAVKKLSKVH